VVMNGPIGFRLSLLSARHRARPPAVPGK